MFACSSRARNIHRKRYIDTGRKIFIYSIAPLAKSIYVLIYIFRLLSKGKILPSRGTNHFIKMPRSLFFVKSIYCSLASRRTREGEKWAQSCNWRNKEAAITLVINGGFLVFSLSLSLSRGRATRKREADFTILYKSRLFFSSFFFCLLHARLGPVWLHYWSTSEQQLCASSVCINCEESLMGVTLYSGMRGCLLYMIL